MTDLRSRQATLFGLALAPVLALTVACSSTPADEPAAGPSASEAEETSAPETSPLPDATTPPRTLLLLPDRLANLGVEFTELPVYDDAGDYVSRPDSIEQPECEESLTLAAKSPPEATATILGTATDPAGLVGITIDKGGVTIAEELEAAKDCHAVSYTADGREFEGTFELGPGSDVPDAEVGATRTLKGTSTTAGTSSPMVAYSTEAEFRGVRVSVRYTGETDLDTQGREHLDKILEEQLGRIRSHP